MKPKILYVLISHREESTDDYTVRECYLHGIMDKKGIQKFNKDYSPLYRKKSTYIIPLNKFIESGMRL